MEKITNPVTQAREQIIREKPSNPKMSLEVIAKDSLDFYSKHSDKWYFVERNVDELSLRRYALLEKMLTELHYTMTYEFLQNSILQQAQYLKENDTYNAYVINHNILAGLAEQEKKDLIMMWVCTVFIYREDEDPLHWDKNVAKQKILDWQESFASGFFLQLRTDLFDNLISTYKAISRAFTDFQTSPQFETDRTEAIETKYGLSPNLEV